MQIVLIDDVSAWDESYTRLTTVFHWGREMLSLQGLGGSYTEDQLDRCTEHQLIDLAGNAQLVSTCAVLSFQI